MNIKLVLIVLFSILVSCTNGRTIDLEAENIELKTTIENLTHELDSVNKIVEYQIELGERATEFARKARIEAMKRAGASQEEIQEALDLP